MPLLISLIVGLRLGAARAEDWDYIEAGKPIPNMYVRFCFDLATATKQRDESERLGKLRVADVDFEQLLIPECFAGPVTLTVLPGPMLLRGGLAWNPVYRADAPYTCEMRIDGYKTPVPCDWVRQEQRYYWAVYMTKDGKSHRGIAQLFPTMLALQYIAQAGQKEAE